MTARALRLPPAVLVSALLLACTPDDGQAESDGDDADDTSGTSDTGTETGTSETGTSETDTGEPAECGNGVVEGDEDCDDANEIDNDFCTNACTSPCALEWSVESPQQLDANSFGLSRIARGPTGDLYVVGQTSVGQPMPAAWVARYGPMGEGPIWESAVTGTPGEGWAYGITVDEAGDAYATGARPGPDGEDIWIARLASADGSQVWVHEHDGAAEGDDWALDVELAADGLVAVGVIRDGDQDSDIWIRKLDFDGNELWTQTYSGAAAANGFSLDGGISLALAEDGAAYVAGQIYVDFETKDTILLRYGPDGSGPDLEQLVGAGGSGHDNYPHSLVRDAAGDLYLGIRDLESPVNSFRVHKLAGDSAELLWSLGNAELALGEGEDPADWQMLRVSLAGDQLVLGGPRFAGDWDGGLGRWESWLGRVDSDGEVQCLAAYANPNDAQEPRYITGLTDAAGEAVAVGWGGLPEGGFSMFLAGFSAPG